MKIIRIKILIGHGSDTVVLETDLIEACWPYVAPMTLTFHAARHDGPAYVARNFPDVTDVEIINL
jgi:hypothetical protein